MNSVDRKSSKHIYWFWWKNYKEDLEFKVSDHVSVSKYKNIFVKGYSPNWKFLLLQKLKILCRGHYVLSDLNGEGIVSTL